MAHSKNSFQDQTVYQFLIYPSFMHIYAQWVPMQVYSVHILFV